MIELDEYFNIFVLDGQVSIKIKFKTNFSAKTSRVATDRREKLTTKNNRVRIIISKDHTFGRRRSRIHQPSITLPQIPHVSRLLFGEGFELPYLGTGRSSNTHHAKSCEGDIFSGNRCSGESHGSGGKWSDSHHDGLDDQKMMISIG